jgi:hypothetical protein
MRIPRFVCGIGSLALPLLSACATTAAQMHGEAQLDRAALACGLARGDMIQDERKSSLLIVHRVSATLEQRKCVADWARPQGLRPVFVNLQFEDETSENKRMMALLAAASAVITLQKMEPDMLPAINIGGTVNRIIAVSVTGAPADLAPLKAELTKDGWKVLNSPDDSLALISPAGHSTDQVTALSFRVTNGEFGNLKFNVTLRPEIVR